MKDKNPYPFDPIWWLGDLDLRSCDPLSRALLVDLMCIMYCDSQKYGYVVVKGSDEAFESIKNYTGIEENELRVALTSLLNKKLIAWDKEKLFYYCPVMIKRKQKMDRNRYQGSKGGNPLLVGKIKEGESTEIYVTKKGKKLRGVQLRAFNVFWQEFGYKSGKADAADTWINLKVDEHLYELIIKGARKENFGRRMIIERGSTPIMAQGWLSGKRWEDGT